MKKQPLVPAVGVTYYSKRGWHAYSPECVGNAKWREEKINQLLKTGLYANVDFYAVGTTLRLLKMELTLLGVDYFSGKPVSESCLSIHAGFFKTHWSLEPEKY